jgi:C1A family cysteine protease
LEAGHAIKHNTTAPRLSVQYLIDCDNVNQACGGGWMLDAYDFTKKEGVPHEDRYADKYNNRKNSCRKPKDGERVKNDDQNEEDNISIERLKELVAVRPVGLAMNSNPSCLMGYSSGVVRESDCKCSFANVAEVNHAVTLVGYGKNTQNNQDECPEYWKIRNSWGPRWGEEGYFKLCIPKDVKSLPTGTCQVQSYVQYPIFN